MTAEVIPATQSGVRVEIDDHGIATLLLDQPNRKVNVMNVAFIEDFERAVNSLGNDLKGLILTSGKQDQFVAGADLEQLVYSTRQEEPVELVRRLHRVLNRLETLPFPKVAAINGPALGGGLELALACDYRVSIESQKNILGLPEVQLGLLPAGGGSQRLPRLIGLSRALSLILEGKRYNPRRARQYGVVDEVVHPAVLMDSARAWLSKGRRTDHPRWSRLDVAAERWPLVRSIVYRQARKSIEQKTKGHYLAPGAALDTIRAGQEQGFGAGLAAEAVAFGQLVMSEAAQSLIHLFLATEALKREQRTLQRQALEVDRVGVAGTGFMGADIAQAAAVGGYGVRLRDLKSEQVARGIKTVRDLTLNAARKRRFTRSEAQDIVAHVSGAIDYSGFARAQLVIEAVFEDLETKRQVIRELEEVLSPDAIIASNTSSLPIGSLAADAQHPERIAGMHFFSPVHKMPLVEVIRAHTTSDKAIATIVEVGRAMGKTVIVVMDGPGFYTTRVLGFMVQQAGHLFEQGASIESIDRAMVRFGFPVGPMALIDEVGIDVSAHVSETLGRAFPDRFQAAGSIERLLKLGRLGRKSKSGFYDYSGRKKKPDPRVYELRDAASTTFPADLIARRLNLSFINEAARCLEEGVIACARDGDIGAVMGIGYPPFLGGPFRAADRLGIGNIVEELRRMEYAYGPSFKPAPILERMAGDGKAFYETKRSDTLALPA